MANAEDVVLYDLDANATAEELIEMMSDPESRWFASARLATLARRGLVAASFDPLEHPRGRDGRFIHKWGWVRWLSKTEGRWKRGQVSSIQPGNILVRDYTTATEYGLKPNQLYNLPTPKAAINLPNLSGGDTSGEGFSKIGGQGGSNLGGLFQTQPNYFGAADSLLPNVVSDVADKYGLTKSSGVETTDTIWYDAADGRIALMKDGLWVDAAGKQVEKPFADPQFYIGTSGDVAKAWGELVARAELLADGDKVYIKYAKSENHAASEVLANRLYEAAGVNVAETIIGSDHRTIGSKLGNPAVKIDIGEALGDHDVMARMRADFAVDAWLANWDVAGLNLENTQVWDGYPYRIDAGGGLLYRAQGAVKGHMFGPTVGELDTLRNPSLNPAAAKIFSDVTDAEIADGVARIAAISPAEIESMSMGSGLDAPLAKEVSDTLIARRQYLLDKYSVEDPFLLDANNDVVGTSADLEELLSDEAAKFAQHLEDGGYVEPPSTEAAALKVLFDDAVDKMQDKSVYITDVITAVEKYADLAGIPYGQALSEVEDALPDPLSIIVTDTPSDAPDVTSPVDLSAAQSLDAKATVNVPEVDASVDVLVEPEGVVVEDALFDTDEYEVDLVNVAGAVGHKIFGVNSQLAVGPPLVIKDMDEVMAESLVGKIVLRMPYVDSSMSPDIVDGVLSMTKASPGYYMAYVESFGDSPYNNKKRLVLRTPSGGTKAINVGDYNADNPVLRVVDNFTVDDLKSASSPTLKTDGTIVYNGKIVGQWASPGYKIPGDYSSGYSHSYSFTLDPAHNVTGLEVSNPKTYKKADLKDRIQALLIPEAKPVKVKKGTKAATKVKAAVEVAETPSLGGATYQNGDEAKLGDWVSSLKGGGGFVGKIVGWPSQDTDPGIAFAVSVEGVQKAVSLKGMKKVPKPSDDAAELDFVPSAYIGVTLASGETPVVGQKVTSGAPGSKQVEGYIHHINPKQGYVYIVTSDGKISAPKKLSVTKLVEQPELWWNYEAAVLPTLSTPVAPKGGKKKVDGTEYPGPDGALVPHDPAKEAEWLAGNAKRKLTKDGYVPAVGMRLRNKTGDELVVLDVADEWSPNPNKLGTWNLTQKKKASTSTNSVEVDHAAILTAFDGLPLQSVALHHNFSSIDIPDGSTIWRISTQTYVSYKNSAGEYKSRYIDDWEYFVTRPDGNSYRIQQSGDGDFSSGWNMSSVANLLKNAKPEAVQKVAIVDYTSDKQLNLTLFKSKHGSSDYKMSSVTFEDVGVVAPVSAPAPVSVDVDTPSQVPVVDTSFATNPASWLEVVAAQHNLHPTTSQWPIVFVDNGKLGYQDVIGGTKLDPNGMPVDYTFQNPKAYTGTQEDVDAVFDLINLNSNPLTPVEAVPEADPVAVPDVPEIVPEPVSVPDAVPEPIDVAEPPKVIPQSSLTVITPPPAPPKVKTGPADPLLPVVVDDIADLSAEPPVLVGTTVNSIGEAVDKMLKKKDESTAGSATVYAAGDSDFIEDMAVRFNVEVNPDGTESLVARFRLREGVAEDTIGRIFTAGEGKKGAWKPQGMKYPPSLEVGDLVGIYLSNHTNLLKPENSQRVMDEPTARVIGKPVLVGKTTVGKDPETGEFFDLWRVQVVTQDGTVGEVDMEARTSASVKTFEWDPEAPVMSPGAKLDMTDTAKQNGWIHRGHIQQRGTSGVHLDENGKTKYPDYIGIKDSSSRWKRGGFYVTKKLDDGTEIHFQAAHPTESGTGFEMIRRNNFAGEVRVNILIMEGKPNEAFLAMVSRAMQTVGVPLEKQQPPSDAQLVNFALTKMVRNYHPTYEYRGKDIDGPNDFRVQEMIASMNAKLQAILGRNVTLADIRLHAYESGRLQAVWSPEVARAIGKLQSAHHYHHRGISNPERLAAVLASPANGLMSADERFSLGILTAEMTPFDDIGIGGGDRVFVRNIPTKSFSNHDIIISPAMFLASPEIYTKLGHDGWGKRNESNAALAKPSASVEYTYKRTIDPEQITLYIAADPGAYIATLKARGVTEIGGRPIEEIVVTPEQAKKLDLDEIGSHIWEHDVPITKLMVSDAA